MSNVHSLAVVKFSEPADGGVDNPLRTLLKGQFTQKLKFCH